MVSIIICSSIFLVEVVFITVMLVISNKVHRQDLEEWKHREEHK